MKNPAELIGKKVRGFKFNGYLYRENMNDFIDKIGIIQEYEKEYFRVFFNDTFRWYPADQIEAHLVDEENEIPTFTKEALKEAFNVGFSVGVNDNESPSYLDFEQWFNKRFGMTKEEQLTAILGNSDKVKEIMEVFNCKE